MTSKDNSIGEMIESLSLQVCMLEVEDIPGMGKVYDTISALEKGFPDPGCQAFTEVIQGFKYYFDRFVLSEITDVKPLENGIMTLQAIWRDVSSGREFMFDISDVLEDFGYMPDGSNDSGGAAGETAKRETGADAPVVNEGEVLTAEDIDIIRDFIIESRENLEVVELHLIELEQNPDDTEIINAIFRSFHTIKGVSGFLKLNKMNHFCHHAESLMDSARSGDVTINDSITDIILESVDTLKLMLESVERSIETGISATFDEIDVDSLIRKIQTANMPDGNKTPLGKILVDSGAVTEESLRDSLEVQKKHPEKKLGEILVQEKKVDAGAIRSALKTQASGKNSAGLQVKVDTEKLDNLVDLTGELVIAQSMFRQFGHSIASDDNQKYFHQLNQVTQAVSAIQKIAMSMRMVPVKHTFQKMVRLVRDLSKNSGKEADLSMSGEDTEIDRNVVDELYEPMVHMIRNSVDHALESPAERESAGKNKKGSIYLRAYQRGGNIIIEIEDDGKGLDTKMILAKARERNLITGDENLSEKEIFNFIMHPGFSTAKEVTDISGRGVGMDVVKKSIEKLRGRLEIGSQKGKGTVFTISLPLTMAIVEGMLVRVGKERYIIPTHAIIKSYRPEPGHCHTVENKGELVRHRESLIPLVRMDRLFDVKGDAVNPWEGIVVVTENHGVQKALLLDELLGKEEFVIKNLGETFQNIKGLAGSAILSDGRVGLILDVAGIFQAAVS